MSERWFREEVSERDYSGKNFSKLFVQKTLIESVCFDNADLSGSCITWTDITRSSFVGANLSDSDLRANEVDGVNFTGANFSNSDLRQSWFGGCNFFNANFEGSKLTLIDAEKMKLSEDQIKSLDIQEDDGEEPKGG